MLKGVTFRTATQQDAEEISEVYLESRKRFQPYARIPYSDDKVRKWIADTVIQKSDVVVAIKNEKIIGMMSLINGENIRWIDHLYIHPDYVNHGLGTQFVEKAKAVLKPPIRLATFQENEKARRFYERHGFIAIDFSDGARNEENRPDVIYEFRS